MPDGTFSRSITSVRWNMLGNVVFIILGAIQTVILARLLPVDVFGVYALANSIIWLTGMIANMGMGGAFVHRADETADEDRAAAVMFSLKCIYTAIWALLLLGGTWLLSNDVLFRLAMTVLTLANAVRHLTQTPNTLLVRRIQHKRLAMIQISNSVLTFICAVGLALAGLDLWALLISGVVTAVVYSVGLYLWKPVWKPYFAWDASIRRYYWSFGLRNMAARVLLYALDKLDDLWTGWLLGDTALGFYSQAYTFATYPRLVLAESVKTVIAGTYADLKQQRQKLADAFTLSNGLIIRFGFLLAGGLALVAPEFIQLLLGEKWLPMLDTFRLMLLFTMLDPIRESTANLFIAVGKPEIIVQTRLIQLGVLVIGLLTLTPLLAIQGVALAVVAMLFVGIAHMLRLAAQEIDYSLREIFLVPGLALTGGLLAGYLLIPALALSSVAGLFLAKGLIFTLVYGSIWILLERDKLRLYSRILLRRQLPSTSTESTDESDLS